MMQATVASQGPRQRRLTRQAIEAVVRRATDRIAPAWPLDQLIAVNPLWGFIEQPLPSAASQAASHSGARLLMPRAWYRDQWQAGQFTDEDVAAAAAEVDEAPILVQRLRSFLEGPEPLIARRRLMTSVADEQLDLTHQLGWSEYVVRSISETCAAYFDDGQALVGPDRRAGLFACWKKLAKRDASHFLLMGMEDLGNDIAQLPDDAATTISTAVQALDVSEDQLEMYFVTLLADVLGWASSCAHRRWVARLDNTDDTSIEELLAIRIAWEWTLYRRTTPSLHARWQMAMASWPVVDEQNARTQANTWIVQRALERAYQRRLCKKIQSVPKGEPETLPFAQLTFCIDVRSEVIRRALEETSSQVTTHGFAGFFGIPAEYRALGAAHGRPQLPGLLAPKLRISETGLTQSDVEARQGRLSLSKTWKALKSTAVSSFSFVEAFGLLFAAPLVRETLAAKPTSTCDAHRPELTTTVDGEPLDAETRCDLAANILKGMGQTKGFARLVVLVGHGSETTNNPQRAGLDCGACCGQSGEVNARAAAALFNDPDVRIGLRKRGIDIPVDTTFVAGLHNTTTDDIRLFDLDRLPARHRASMETLKRILADAGAKARRERAPRLGVAKEDAETALHHRSRAWSVVRPEWGLANNASFVIAPRSFTAGLDLQGRSFLHDYDWKADPEGAVLEQLMTAPMVVAHWINFQYFASTVDNDRYGSGNKVLHNVVGGHLGVFEGNGGDLRIGLAKQSLHDGKQWVHNPLRLSVFIAASRDAIDTVVQKHETVRQLVENSWIHLFQIDDDGQTHAYQRHPTGFAWRSTLST